MPFRILAADHTGITVSDIERSLAFWRDVLGFELSHRAHQKGELAEQITGVFGAEILMERGLRLSTLREELARTSGEKTTTSDRMGVSRNQRLVRCATSQRPIFFSSQVAAAR